MSSCNHDVRERVLPIQTLLISLSVITTPLWYLSMTNKLSNLSRHSQISEVGFRICHTHFLKKLVVLSLLLASSENTTNPHTSATLPSPSLPQIQCQHEKDLQLPFTIHRIICTLNRIHVQRVWSMYAVHTRVRQNCEPLYMLQRAATPRDATRGSASYCEPSFTIYLRPE